MDIEPGGMVANTATTRSKRQANQARILEPRLHVIEGDVVPVVLPQNHWGRFIAELALSSGIQVLRLNVDIILEF